jgi:hypothetical protein
VATLEEALAKLKRREALAKLQQGLDIDAPKQQAPTPQDQLHTPQVRREGRPPGP